MLGIFRLWLIELCIRCISGLVIFLIRFLFSLVFLLMVCRCICLLRWLDRL